MHIQEKINAHVHPVIMHYIDYNANGSCKSGQPQLLPPYVLQLNEENWTTERVLNFISGKICFLTIIEGWDLKQASRRRWILISLPMVSPSHPCTSAPLAAGRDHPAGYKALGLHRSTPAPLFLPPLWASRPKAARGMQEMFSPCTAGTCTTAAFLPASAG